MKKKHDMILLGIALLVVLILFGAYCPMEEIIGIPCPGCNMLTALYASSCCGSNIVSVCFKQRLFVFVQVCSYLFF